MHSHFSVLCENPYIRLAMGYFSENMSVYMCSRNIYTVYRPRPIQSPTETSLLMTDMKSCTENTSMILWCCSFEPGEEKKNAKTKRVRKWRKRCEQPSSHFIKKSTVCVLLANMEQVIWHETEPLSFVCDGGVDRGLTLDGGWVMKDTWSSWL